jgi:hypothetical protein
MSKEYNLAFLKNYLHQDHINKLHEQAFLDTHNLLINFVERSEKLYEELEDIWSGDKKSKETKNYLSQVANSIMGAGKTTSLKVVAKMAIEQKKSLLCAFNNKDTMNDLYNSVKRFAEEYGYTQGIIQAHEDNYYDVVHQLSEYNVVAITQQRLRDIALGYGDFHPLKYHTPESREGWVSKRQRSIIIDEMPDFVDGEIFDIGGINNCLDWFDAMSKNLKNENIKPSDLRKARLIINHLFATEFTEVEDEDNKSIASRRLFRFVEGSPQKELLESVLSSLKTDVKSEYKNRHKWFMRLLRENGVGVVNRDEKTTNLICAELIDYRKFGNVLVLDGTADITEGIYKKAGYELIKLPNYHNYKERLHLRLKDINTSKENRKNPDVHSKIACDIVELRQKGKNILPLPSKQDIQTYKKLGVITTELFDKFFKGRASVNENEHESMALNLLNTTGKNDLSKYDCLGMLTLPIRHPAYYKLFAIAVHGTSKNVSLLPKTKGRQSKDSVKWFQDSDVQEIFERLMLMDFSQIIHRSSLRNMKQNNEVDIVIYTNRVGWLDKMLKLYKIPSRNGSVYQLFLKQRFKQECIQKAKEVSTVMLRDKTKLEFNPKDISSGFKKWLNRNWNDVERRGIIEGEFNQRGITFVEEQHGKSVYKKLIHK